MKIEYIYDGYALYRGFSNHLLGLFATWQSNRPVNEVVADFFDITLIHLSQSVHDLPEFDLHGTVIKDLPVSVKIDLQAQLTDLYADNFYEYVFESDYFDHEKVYNSRLASEVAATCIRLMEFLLRDIYALLIANLKDRTAGRAQGGEFDHYFLERLQMYRIVNRTDIYVLAEVGLQ